MSNILIIGNGVVGHNLAKELHLLSPDVYDKYRQEENTKRRERYDFAFVCVPTDYRSPDAPCDCTEVENAINENQADVYIIKSAILPGTTDALREKTGKRIVVCPEYQGYTRFSTNYQFDYTIVGGPKEDCHAVVQLLYHVYDGRHRFYSVDAKTAELAKYMENSYLAMKVSFCVQFWDIANQIGVDYGVLRELFILDPRVNPAHTLILDDQPYWDSPCLNKDVRAIAETYRADLLESVIRYNEKMKDN